MTLIFEDINQSGNAQTTNAQTTEIHPDDRKHRFYKILYNIFQEKNLIQFTALVDIE